MHTCTIDLHTGNAHTHSSPCCIHPIWNLKPKQRGAEIEDLTSEMRVTMALSYPNVPWSSSSPPHRSTIDFPLLLHPPLHPSITARQYLPPEWSVFRTDPRACLRVCVCRDVMWMFGYVLMSVWVTWVCSEIYSFIVFRKTQSLSFPFAPLFFFFFFHPLSQVALTRTLASFPCELFQLGN